MSPRNLLSVSVAEAKKRLSELLGRVAFGNATVIILRRGKPMAKLVAAETLRRPPHLGEVKVWLDDDDRFITAVDRILRARGKRRPRTMGRAPTSRQRGRSRR
jgi:prevent-host-death family protein